MKLKRDIKRVCRRRRRLLYFLSFPPLQAVKALMLDRKLRANAQTFCCMALACRTQEDGLWLLADMEVSSRYL